MSARSKATELRLAELIWQYAPVERGELLRRAQEDLGLSRLGARVALLRLRRMGAVGCRDGVVTALMDRQAFLAERRRRDGNQVLGGGAPSAVAEFTQRSALNERDPNDFRALTRGCSPHD